MFKKVLRGGIELGPEAKTVSDQYAIVIMLIQKWAFFRKQIKIAGFLANDDFISIIDAQYCGVFIFQWRTKKSQKITKN